MKEYIVMGLYCMKELVDKIQARFEVEVIAISKEPTALRNVLNHTGDDPLIGRAREIMGAICHIGLASGLGVLANCVGTPSIMLATNSFRWHIEEENRYIVERNDVCRGCVNDLSIPHSRSWNYCPRNMDYQCSRYITPDAVIGVVEQIFNANIERRKQWL